MKTTARNQFPGTITAIDPGPVSTDVPLKLADAQEIAVTVTSHAAHGLDLQVGQQAMALVKSSAILLVTDFAGYALSARNQLRGTVSRLDRGAVSSLVGLTLPGGAVVTASITNDSVDALALELGNEATAVFKAYAPILAVPARKQRPPV